MYCKQCGSELLNGIRQCPKCGAEVNISPDTNHTFIPRSETNVNLNQPAFARMSQDTKTTLIFVLSIAGLIVGVITSAFLIRLQDYSFIPTSIGLACSATAYALFFKYKHEYGLHGLSRAGFILSIIGMSYNGVLILTWIFIKIFISITTYITIGSLL